MRRHKSRIYAPLLFSFPAIDKVDDFICTRVCRRGWRIRGFARQVGRAASAACASGPAAARRLGLLRPPVRRLGAAVAFGRVVLVVVADQRVAGRTANQGGTGRTAGDAADRKRVRVVAGQTCCGHNRDAKHNMHVETNSRP